jgi:membrane protein
MSNLREALTAQWEGAQGQGAQGQAAPFPGSSTGSSPGMLRTKLLDLLALLGLGLALVVSFALTGAGTAFANLVLRGLGLEHIPGAWLALEVLTIAVSVAAMWLVFLWVLARLPRRPVPLRRAMRAAWWGALGFELLKQVFAIYLNSVTRSPTGQLFGPVIGLMVFAYFVSRFVLFLTAWAAVAPAPQDADGQPVSPQRCPVQSGEGGDLAGSPRERSRPEVTG